MLGELDRGIPSAVTARGDSAIELTEAELKERMSGNLCRCGASAGICDAIRSAHVNEAMR